MSHECPDCGGLCYCDMDDCHMDAPNDCRHRCPPEADDEYQDEDLDGIEEAGEQDGDEKK